MYNLKEGNDYMEELLIKEVKYLRDKCSEVSYNTERFKLFIGEDRYLFGSISPKGESSPFDKLMQYKTIYDTLTDLDWKIKLSFENGIEYAYSDSLQKKFHITGTTCEEERLAYYYIENALFRTSTLWDILAQLFCLFYNIKISKKDIYYTKLFNPKSKGYYKKYSIYKIQKFKEFEEYVEDISNYLKQEDNTELEGECQGNHRYTNKWRNKMIHRNSPNVTTISDYDFNLKSHPICMLKRIIDDYAVVSKYIDNILNIIETESIQNLKQI